MDLREKLKILMDNKMLSLTEIEKKNSKLKKFALYYFINGGNTTQYKELQTAVNEIIKQKLKILNDLAE